MTNILYGRRSVLKTGFSALLALTCAPGLAQAALPAAMPARSLRLHHLQTGETFSGEYWAQGRYLPDAFRGIKNVLRDYHNNQQFPIDPRLMDVLYVLQYKLGNKNGFGVLSGYRSPETNAMLCRFQPGAARNSLHMSGQAIDLRLPGTDLYALRQAAMALGAGGVGYYPSDNFIHIDTGRVRTW